MRYSTFFLCALVLACAARGQSLPAPLDPDYLSRPVQREVLPGGAELLAEVRARLPQEKRTITARLTTRNAGQPETVCNAESVLDFGANPPTARYLLTDGLGGAIEQLVVAWDPKGQASYAFSFGPDLTRDPAFAPTRPVNGLDFNWSDLSLSFLWWPGAQVRGTEQIKLRKCYVMEIPAPAELRDQGTAVRVWIDAKEKLMMKAAVLDANREPLRTIEVDSIKKINDIWMVKDLDIENLRTGARSRVRVHDIR